ncbi:TrbI/VirB10 family protein [Giesbergeria anulus]|uniref:Type IV secretion system protein VirB10 n=1 Tax=Giesbergeria anulus TaxID=180197 RepID=A0A1H9NDC0_9BURK|nr:TrbI/VirB10 family protein [Giesbergeria anulus]SER33954.1 type IV secretion system protein VirB10 [Giesbergeria anulus]
MQENNMPHPSMNPLDDLDELPKSPAQYKKSKQKTARPPEEDLPHDEHDNSVQRGMPGRNLKNWAIGILGLAVAGSMLWPQSQGSKDKAVTTKQQSEASIADELERSKPVVTVLEETVVPQPPSPPPIVKMATEPATNRDDEKMALILASPMGTDVQLSSSSKTSKEKAPPADALPNFDSSKIAEDAMRQQERMMAAIAAAESDGAKKKPDSLHAAFLKESKGIEAPIGMVDARKPNTIYEGTLIRTVLTRKVQTDLPGVVTAKVMSDVYDSVTMQTMLIPRGSEVTCRYQSELLVGQEVVLAACERLRLPNGKSFSLMSTPASDMQGASGLPADVNNHFFKMFGTSLMLGAASLLLPDKDQRITVSSSNGSQEKGGSILGTALHDTITTILQRNARIPPTGTVEIGTPFTLTISRDVEMEPYTGR